MTSLLYRRDIDKWNFLMSHFALTSSTLLLIALIETAVSRKEAACWIYNTIISNDRHTCWLRHSASLWPELQANSWSFLCQLEGWFYHGYGWRYWSMKSRNHQDTYPFANQIFNGPILDIYKVDEGSIIQGQHEGAGPPSASFAGIIPDRWKLHLFSFFYFLFLSFQNLN